MTITVLILVIASFAAQAMRRAHASPALALAAARPATADGALPRAEPADGLRVDVWWAKFLAGAEVRARARMRTPGRAPAHACARR